MLDVNGSREIQAAVLALRAMDRTLRSKITKASRSQIVPEWKQAVAGNTTTSLENRFLLHGVRADVTDSRVRLVAAGSTKRRSGGASPATIGHALEFGARWHTQNIRATSSRGKNYSYTRVVNKQFKPRRQKGYVIVPAAVKLAPRFVSLWVQTTVRHVHEAFEGKSS